LKGDVLRSGAGDVIPIGMNLQTMHIKKDSNQAIKFTLSAGLLPKRI
jgi:hypothetical protein